MATRAFLPQEMALALFFTAAVEVGLVGLLVLAGQNRVKVVAHEDTLKEEVPIAVKPVMDDLPLLKLGSKKVKAKLPDMWTKQAPVQRFTETSAPSEKAAKTPEAIPTTPLAKADAAPPPPDAALAKEVDQPLTDAGPKPEANLPTEGAADGVKEGTETDPLKARAANLYRAKLLAWFQARFQAPGNLPCDVVHGLSASASISVGPDRTITAATLGRASNNPDFDARVKTALDNFVGQQLPPPPPLYPDLSPGTSLQPSFSGKTAPCADSTPPPASPAPAPASPEPPASPVALLLLPLSALADAPPAPEAGSPLPDEGVLGAFVITGSNTGQERLPKIAVLPSLSPAYEDVIVRGVVRRDFELTGLYDLIPDSQAPEGLYGFEDPIDLEAWQKVGAEAIVKVSAQKKDDKQISVLGIAYFLNVGKEPVYQKTIVVPKGDARITAHRITDALLGALTGRPGSFASELTFSGKWAQNRRIFRMDADGNSLLALTDPMDTAIAPNFGAPGHIFYPVSHDYSPFTLMEHFGTTSKPVNLPFKTSVYSLAFNKERTKLAVAVSEDSKSAIYVGNPDGSDMKKVSTSELATRPAWSPSGKLAWVGGDPAQGSQRIWVDGKPVSPAGFTAASPTFCDTEDGVRLIYSVAVGGNRQDLIIAAEKGQGMARLTQNQGSNSYPACSPDGRLVAFFSNRNKNAGIYLMSLKSWKSQQISTQEGESLNWAPLPAVPSAP